MIATDDSSSQTKAKEEAKGEDNNKEKTKNKRRFKPKLDAEFGVVRGIDFKKVHTVINYDMPQSVTGYIHRIGRTGRAYSSGSSVSLVSFLVVLFGYGLFKFAKFNDLLLSATGFS